MISINYKIRLDLWLKILTAKSNCHLSFSGENKMADHQKLFTPPHYWTALAVKESVFEDLVIHAHLVITTTVILL